MIKKDKLMTWSSKLSTVTLMSVSALLGAFNPMAASGAEPVLVVPSAETTLHLSAPAASVFPHHLSLRSSPQTAEHVTVPGPSNRSWRLIELENRGQSIPVEFVEAVAADGLAEKNRWQLTANIPPLPEAGARSRRFRLESSVATRGVTEQTFRFAAVDEKSLGLWEGERPVFVYNHGVMSKAGVPADRNRSTYLHPLYGLDGEVLTDDFPRDHYHHRGLFWAWPHVTISGQQYSTWDIRGLHQRFERWLARDSGPVAATLGVDNGWFAGDRKLVQERIWLRIYRTAGDAQAIDVDLTLIPLQEPLTLAGAEGKSYGGLTLRFAPRTNTIITTPLGRGEKDLPMTRLPWADLSAQFAGTPQPSGAAIFVAPDHPDYPPMWLTRHYGVLCLGWPGVEAKTFPVDQPIRCRYRVWIHRGAPSATALRREYEAYQSLSQIKWETANH